MTSYSFQKYKPFSLRLWHWLNMLVILALLGTVLLRKTFLSWRTNSAVIEAKLNEAGSLISPELARDIAVAIRNPLWDWHIYLGFSLAVLMLSRILIAVFIEKRCPAFHAVKSALGIKNLPSHERAEALHYTLVRISYAVFYLATVLMLFTGFMLFFKTDLGLSKDLVGTIKESHELLMWFFVIFACGHLAGIIIAENRKNPGIVSDMVNGGSR